MIARSLTMGKGLIWRVGVSRGEQYRWKGGECGKTTHCAGKWLGKRTFGMIPQAKATEVPLTNIPLLDGQSGAKAECFSMTEPHKLYLQRKRAVGSGLCGFNPL